MWNRVLTHGGIAGLIVGLPMIAMMLLWPDPDHGMQGGVVYGYTAMLVALTMVFLGVKAHRDKALGGVIKFLPALGVGLLISVVASVIYALAWEVSLALTGFDFGAQYSKSMIEGYRAQGCRDVPEPAAARSDDHGRNAAGRSAGVAGVGGAVAQ